LDELEEAQKGKTGSADISLGLVRDDDTYMHDWQATIFQSAVSLLCREALSKPSHCVTWGIPMTLFCISQTIALQGGGEPRIWFLSLYADDKYPSSAPKVKFTSKISADFVDAKGNVSEREKLVPEPMSTHVLPLMRSTFPNPALRALRFSAGAAREGALPVRLDGLQNDGRGAERD
jgi:hypothetical protein